MIAALESGIPPWRQAWQSGNEGLPANVVTGRRYGGINVMLLWSDAVNKGYERNRWLTFRQAREAGRNVRRGEKSTTVVLFKPFQKAEEDEHGRMTTDENGDLVMRNYRMMDSFHLFNIDQCENLPDKLCPEQPVLPEAERIAGADKIVTANSVPVRHNNGGRACYHPVADHIIMPQAAQFRSPADYYSTLLHELVHSTGHASRLAREGIVDCPADKHDPVYGFEELVAEMGAAFLCADLGIQGDLQHESYTLIHSNCRFVGRTQPAGSHTDVCSPSVFPCRLPAFRMTLGNIASWLTILKEDKRAIFRAARYAREAFEYLSSETETCR